MTIALPDPSLVLLIGPSGSGKSTFAARHFKPTEVVSSDFCRALISGDEADQSVSVDAFEVLHLIVAKRLKAGKLAAVDATNVFPAARASLLALAAAHGIPAIGIVFHLPGDVIRQRNRKRAGRVVEEAVIDKQTADLEASLEGLAGEGFAAIHVLRDVRQAEELLIERRLEPKRSQ